MRGNISDSKLSKQSWSLYLVAWYQVKEVAARYGMGKCSGIGHPSSIQPTQGGCFNCPLIWYSFNLFPVFRYFSANSRERQFLSFQIGRFLWHSYVGTSKRGGGGGNLRYSLLLSPLPCSKWDSLPLFRIKAVIIHFLCCDNPLPKCPGSIIWLRCLDSYHIIPTKQQCLKCYNPRNPELKCLQQWLIAC